MSVVTTFETFNRLTEKLLHRIRSEGPIPFRDWMATALYGSEDGYYCRSGRQRWGREGDYRTSPERSSLFGAVFANYIASLYEQMARPTQFKMIECGGGDGKFAFDVLENLMRNDPQMLYSIRYVFDEASRSSIETAHQRLKPFEKSIDWQSLTSLQSINTGVVFANELFDAFPIHRVVRRADGFHEYYVNEVADAFGWVEGPLSSRELLEFCERNLDSVLEDQSLEVNLAIKPWLQSVAETLQRGYVIVVDYGAESEELQNPELRPNGSLRAYRNHQLVDDVLSRPGDCDITSSVDWTHTRTVAQEVGFSCVTFERLDSFLLQEGLLAELQRTLDRIENGAYKTAITVAAREMVLPQSMAAGFQVLILKR
ncbi:MAG: class I SAM-dependent methyltransferase [Pyrinomonadaceae bacterium]